MPTLQVSDNCILEGSEAQLKDAANNFAEAQYNTEAAHTPRKILPWDDFGQVPAQRTIRAREIVHFCELIHLNKTQTSL